MNYSDVPTRSKTTYSQLKDTQNFNCDQTCLCRFTEERSAKDKMYYDWFVLDKPVNFPDNKENFDMSESDPFKNCIRSSRQGGYSENCQDVEKVYVTGKATENFDMSKSEPFKNCICSSRQGGCSENCQDVEKVEIAYVTGKATENSDRKAPGWNRGPEIGSYKFPKSCGGAPFTNHPNFGPWDFTEFGQ